MRFTRSLITFAFVSEQYEQTGDIALGLLPLFAPIVNKRAGEPFDPQTFAQDVEEMYDLKMHPYVAEEFTGRLASAGYLVRDKSTDNQLAHYYNADVADAESRVDEDNLNRLLANFLDYAQEQLKRHDIAISESEVEEAFFSHLVTHEFLSLVNKPDRAELSPTTLTLDREDNSEVDDNSREAQLDYLCARFLVKLNEKSPDDIELLMEIANGVLMAEIVLGLQHPPHTGEEFEGLCVFLDSPLLMNALELGHDDQVQYAKQFLEECRAVNLRLAAFPHVIEEMERSIRTPLSNYENGRDVYGPLGIKLLQRSTYASYVQSILSNLTKNVEELGVEIYQYPKAFRLMKERYYSDESEEQLADAIGWYFHPEARLKDAKSVADVLRIRRDTRAYTITDAGYVFVTHNALLVKRATEFLLTNGLIADNYFPPCITDRYMAGLIWITKGGGGSSLPRRRLIANCASTIAPRKDVTSRMHRFLVDLDETKAQHFEALMTNQRAQHFLMEATMGDAKLITTQNFEELYEEVERIAAEKVAREKDSEMKQREDRHRRELEAARQSHDNEMARVTRDLEATQSHLANEREQRERMETQVQHLNEWKDRNEKMQLQQCVNTGKRAEQRAKQWIGLGLFVLLVLVGVGQHFLPALLGVNSKVAYAVAGALIAIGAIVSVFEWFVFPRSKLKRWVQGKRDEAFEKAVAQSGLDAVPPTLKVDWEAGKVVYADNAK